MGPDAAMNRRHFISTAAVLAGDRRINLVPFYKVLGERYAVFWKVQG